MSNSIALYSKRDAKAKPHLSQYAPVWLIDQEIVPEDETVLFNIVFLHKDYGWVNRKYRYDGFNNVLYYRGQLSISEETTIEVQDTEPYIPTITANTPNSYGG